MKLSRMKHVASTSTLRITDSTKDHKRFKSMGKEQRSSQLHGGLFCAPSPVYCHVPHCRTVPTPQLPCTRALH
jgi:hypothetical protein